MAIHMRSVVVCLVAIAALFCGVRPHGHAQSASDKAAAESLFDRGLVLLKEGRFQEACERLEQSQSIDRGIGTMLYLAECYEKIGKTASAWAVFREAASWAQAEGQTERAEAGRRRAEKLEKGLSRLAVQVPPANKVDGLSVSDNGSILKPTVWGLALPVDPGVHRIEAHAPGYLPWSSEVKVGGHAETAEARVPLLEKDPNAVVASSPVAPTAVETAQAAETANTAAAASPAPSTQMSNQRIAGLVVGGVGVVALAVGAITGGLAIKNNKDSKDRTDSDGNCIDDKCSSLSRTAYKQATVSTVGWAAGGALVAAGLLTFFLGPKHQARADVAVRVDRQTAALRVGGVF